MMADGMMRRFPDSTGSRAHLGTTSHEATLPTIGQIDTISNGASWRRNVSRLLETTLAAITRVGRHWLLILHLLFGVTLGLAIVVPMLYMLGQDSIASRIFALYHFICAQVPSHSYFLGGYQVALCARNLAIYGSLFSGTLIFRVVRNRLPTFGWRLWFLTMLPMALDGFTQMFGLRESNWELRTLTGIIFGLGLCWFILPQIDEAARGDNALAPQTRRVRIELDLGLAKSIIRRVFAGQSIQSKLPRQAGV
jgi:uncharacterized membrane protein